MIPWHWSCTRLLRILIGRGRRFLRKHCTVMPRNSLVTLVVKVNSGGGRDPVVWCMCRGWHYRVVWCVCVRVRVRERGGGVAYFDEIVDKSYLHKYFKQEQKYLWSYRLLNLFARGNKLKFTTERFRQMFFTYFLALKMENNHLALVFSFLHPNVNGFIDIAVLV